MGYPIKIRPIKSYSNSDRIVIGDLFSILFFGGGKKEVGRFCRTFRPLGLKDLTWKWRGDDGFHTKFDLFSSTWVVSEKETWG